MAVPLFSSFLYGKKWSGMNSFSPDNSPGGQEPGGTGFPACAKNTLLFAAI